MPIVLATGAPTASGRSYNDVLGKQYEYPRRYRALVRQGEPFVYYRGSRGSGDGRSVYFGSGVVGLSTPSPNGLDLVAQVHDVRLFDEPLAAKSVDGVYVETGTQRGTNWSNGVRRISDSVFAQILESQDPNATALPGLDRAAFASPQHASSVERYSVEIALRLLAAEFGESAVHEMPVGNPGFDILVEDAGGDLHIEVKGTVLTTPVFHLSEGQRRHAAALGERFRLIVVYGIELAARTHRVAIRPGPLAGPEIELQPEAWTGRLILQGDRPGPSTARPAPRVPAGVTYYGPRPVAEP